MNGILILCMLIIMSMHGMERPLHMTPFSLEKVQEKTIASICERYQDPCDAFIEIEKQGSLTLEDLINFLSIAAFSKHVRILLCKMNVIVSAFGFKNAQQMLYKTLLAKFSPIIQEFLLRRYAATYEWETECTELEDKEYDYLKKRGKSALSRESMLVSITLEPSFVARDYPQQETITPTCITVTYSGKQLWQKKPIQIEFIVNVISKSGKCAVISIGYIPINIAYKQFEKRNEFLFMSNDHLFLNSVTEIVCISSEGQNIDLKKAIESKLDIVGDQIFTAGDLNIGFSPNDEFLCLTDGRLIFLIALLQKTIYRIPVSTIFPSIARGKPEFSADAAILCLLMQRDVRLSCWVIDTSSKRCLREIALTIPFFKTVYIMPDNNSLILKTGDSYQLLKKTYSPHFLFRNHCVSVLKAQRDLHLKGHQDHLRELALLAAKRTGNAKKEKLPVLVSLQEHGAIAGEGKQNAQDRQYKNYLSIDAAGMDVLIVADFLVQLEDYLGAPLAKHFDVITGSGFGAVVGLGIVASLDGTQPLNSACALRDTFEQHGSYIFNSAQRAAIKPFYNNKNLRGVLRGIFHNTRLSDAKSEFALPIQIKNPSIQPFSYTRDQARTREINDIYLAELALYATADTQFFPAIETKHYKCPLACKISASEVYKDNGAQYIYDEYMSGAAESTMRLLSISPHLSSEAAQRTHNLFKQRLGLQNYMHLHADRSDIVKEPDNCLPQVLNSYASASENICQKAEGFLRKLLDNKSS